MEQSPFRLETLRALREHAEACAKHALAEELAVGAKRHADLRRAEEALEQARQAAADASKLDGTGLAARDAFIARRQRERVVAQQWRSRRSAGSPRAARRSRRPRARAARSSG
jgi:hypothetical protein